MAVSERVFSIATLNLVLIEIFKIYKRAEAY